jgi:hypothetical protein
VGKSHLEIKTILKIRKEVQAYSKNGHSIIILRMANQQTHLLIRQMTVQLIIACNFLKINLFTIKIRSNLYLIARMEERYTLHKAKEEDNLLLLAKKMTSIRLHLR